LLLRAARQLEAYDPRLARDTYLDAVNAAMFAGPLAGDTDQLRAAEAALAAPVTGGPPRPVDLLLEGLAALVVEGHATGVPKVRKALEAFASPDLPAEVGLRWMWVAALAAAMIWDHDAWGQLADRHLALCETSGQVAARPFALSTRASVDIFAGDLASAAALADEVKIVSEAVGISHPAYVALMVAAWQGRDQFHAALRRTADAEASRRGEGVALIVSGWGRAVLCNSLGRYREALTAAAAAADHPRREASVGVGWALVEYVEAAVRAGVPGDAAEAFGRLVELTRPSGTEWALGVEARCRALLTEGGEAEAYYREAVERLGRTGVRGELARARLLYGEWLRRERRQREAREQLRAAHEEFSAMRMEAFARRAERELQATGERTRESGVEASNDLTSQETQIVRLVREGLTNAEIGARIFISPRTVEWHLRNIFPKLGVTSRRQLQRAQQGVSSG
ncbi:LuxR C-terminal-related transcriptional regulator, partial [Streptomyces sp. NPDC013178]|uniref:helix-turn-helix transcriptional regulator n=1 Tax=Streptomyces sp. NPDC013178 TaxID=3155118 RepID=UPI0033D44785